MKKIQLDKTYINIVLSLRAIYYQYFKSHNINDKDIMVLMAISKITSSNMGSCTMTELEMYLSGLAKRDSYKHIRKLKERGYILCPSVGLRTKKYITLTDSGNTLLSQIHRSLYNRISKLNDQLKLRAVNVRAKRKYKARKFKAPLLPGNP